MVRSCKGIEMLVNLINICYCAMKILPYQDEQFSEYRTKSVQEFRFELSQGIRSQIFLTNFVRNIETHMSQMWRIGSIPKWKIDSLTIALLIKRFLCCHFLNCLYFTQHIISALFTKEHTHNPVKPICRYQELVLYQ